MNDPLQQLYPELGAGDFTRDDHHVVFYSRVHALLDPDMVVLDFGAGRGRWVDFFAADSYKLKMLDLRGRCARVVGCDVDPAVLGNPLVDIADQIDVDSPLPYADASIDLILSWAVFEHVAEPEWTVREFARILKPGGWICAWTTNRWGMIGLGARLIPDRFHRQILARLNDARDSEDIFPTVYRMNSKRRLRQLFVPEHFEHHTYGYAGPPPYHAGRVWLARLLGLYGRLTPDFLATTLHVFIRKKPTNRSPEPPASSPGVR